MIKVFISGPFSIGGVEENLRKQIDASDKLITLGYNPLPLILYCYDIELVHPRDYNMWIKLTLDFVQVCDCVLRVPGESKGADGEVAYAITHNIPVFYSIEDLDSWFKNL